jgi:hypothetical protein
MVKTNEHGRLIAAAARAALSPLGCTRKGRSRLWYSDQRFWLVSIEFQPSGWSKGSYLNLGAKWLWSTGSGIDLSYRPLDFIPFESTEQFRPLVESIAVRAAQEVRLLRERFRSLGDVYRYLVARTTSEGWRVYYAAVAAGLVGDTEMSCRLFQRMEAWPTYGYDWQIKLKRESAALSALLDDPLRYRSAVLTIIDKQRALMGLHPDPHCLDDELGPIVGP